ncbi:MAG TPA: DUF1501 domain-containing protein [Pyrinomonadaceae bacterium]|jgi:uncharacterized protein (DUF1501 family)|nr:DUF1501 domain-containing protein [Pyrinomonadaceae bacterium]
MAHSRRDFLRNTACALGGVALASTVESLGLINAYAQSAAAAADYRALVCIFMSGGNDCNNTVVDINQFTNYSNVRGASGLSLAQSSLIPVSPSNGGSYGLHPNLSPEVGTPGATKGLLDVWNQGKLAVVANVGPLVEPLTRTTYQNGTGRKPLQLFSHSDQVGLWQSSIANNASQTGWGGRVADKTGGLNGSATFPQIITIAGISLFVTGTNARPLAIADSNTALANVLPYSDAPGFTSSQTAARRAAFDSFRALDPGVQLVKAAADIRSSALQTRTSLASVNPSINTVFPSTTLGRQLLQVARVIKASNDPTAGINMKRQIFFVTLGGFDTHSQQINGQGSLLLQLSQAMRAFYDATVELGVSTGVTTFTLSDFGRTFSPSGSGAATVGSDHGWGSHHFVMGGAVVGGTLYGTYPTLALGGPNDTDTRGRWIPTTSVDQYAATLANWYGLASSDFPAVFPLLGNFSPNNLGFLL